MSSEKYENVNDPIKIPIPANGIINLRSADAKAGTGGILLHLNELPVSSPSSAKSSAVGYLSIMPTDPISSEIELASTFGKVSMKNK